MTLRKWNMILTVANAVCVPINAGMYAYGGHHIINLAAAFVSAGATGFLCWVIFKTRNDGESRDA